MCQDISSKDQEFSNKKPRRSTREQNRTPSNKRAQCLSTSRVQVLSIFGPPRSPFALNFSGILRARGPRAWCILMVHAPPGGLASTWELTPGAGAAAAAAHGPAARKPHGFALLCPLNMGRIIGGERSPCRGRGRRSDALIPAHRMPPSASRHCKPRDLSNAATPM